MSKKGYERTKMYGGDFSLCDGSDLTLSRHARRRCKERHINPFHVESAHAIIRNRVVITAWQKEPNEFGTRSSKGEDYIRRKHKAVAVPKDVLVHLPKYAMQLEQREARRRRAAAKKNRRGRSKKKLQGNALQQKSQKSQKSRQKGSKSRPPPKMKNAVYPKLV